jgi:hypothetical protein
MAAGSSSATVTFGTAFSAGTTYHVSLAITNHPDLTGSSGWGYLGVGSETVSGFTITLYDSQGTAYTVPTGQSIAIDYIAMPQQ